MTCTLAEDALQKLRVANNFALGLRDADKLHHERDDARRTEEETVERERRRARTRSSPLECRICRRAGLHALPPFVCAIHITIGGLSSGQREEMGRRLDDATFVLRGAPVVKLVEGKV